MTVPLKTLARIALAGALGLGLSACAAGSTDAHAAAAGGLLPEFVLGLWHGLIAPLTLIAEIVNWLLPHVLPWKPKFFETGAGVAYDIGFFLTVSGGPHFVIYSRRRMGRRRRDAAWDGDGHIRTALRRAWKGGGHRLDAASRRAFGSSALTRPPPDGVLKGSGRWASLR